MTGDAYAKAALSARRIAEGLRFPEGPIALPDGSLLFVEIEGERLSQLSPAGDLSIVARIEGGPNGAAVGPDGAVYIANNGGFAWNEHAGELFPQGRGANYVGGRLQRVDRTSGAVTTILTEVEGRKLSAPNDLVFDADGDLWFTDSGHEYDGRRDLGGVGWCRADGSEARWVVYPLLNPNGIGISPDGVTLYVALTLERQVVAYAIAGPGRIEPGNERLPGRVLAGFAGRTFLDSLGIQADGAVVVATLLDGPGLVTIARSGEIVGRTPLPGIIVTNVDFGGPNGRTAYVTVGSGGTIYALDWPSPGLGRARRGGP